MPMFGPAQAPDRLLVLAGGGEAVGEVAAADGAAG